MKAIIVFKGNAGSKFMMKISESGTANGWRQIFRNYNTAGKLLIPENGMPGRWNWLTMKVNTARKDAGNSLPP